MEARAFVPGQWPLQNRHERLRPAVQLDAARIARYAATRCSSPRHLELVSRCSAWSSRSLCRRSPARSSRPIPRSWPQATSRVLDPCRAQRRTARLIRVLDPRAVLTLGDNQYEDGRFADFMDSYRPTWGGSSAGPTRRRATTTTTSRGRAGTSATSVGGRIAARAACTA